MSKILDQLSIAWSGDFARMYRDDNQLGGFSSMEDLETVNRLGKGRVDLTIGSALDIFGRALSYRAVVQSRRI